VSISKHKRLFFGLAVIVIILAAASLGFYGIKAHNEAAQQAAHQNESEQQHNNLVSAEAKVSALFIVRDKELASTVTTSTIDAAATIVAKVTGSEEASLTASVDIARTMYADQLAAQQAVSALKEHVATAQIADATAASALVAKVTNADLKKSLTDELTAFTQQINDRIAQAKAAAAASQATASMKSSSSSKASSPSRSASAGSPSRGSGGSGSSSGGGSSDTKTVVWY